MHPLRRKESALISHADAATIGNKLVLSSMETIQQFTSFVWDFAKYTIGDTVSVHSSNGTPWFGKIEQIFGHVIANSVLQAVFKIVWYHIAAPQTTSHPTKYHLQGTSDILFPQTIIGHVLVVPDFQNPLHCFIQQHFSTYYSKYVKNKYI
jgi:hypothetical protein